MYNILEEKNNLDFKTIYIHKEDILPLSFKELLKDLGLSENEINTIEITVTNARGLKL